MDFGILLLLVLALTGFGWIHREFGRARRDRAAMVAELERIASALGQPARTQPMIRCTKCGTFYGLGHSGCPACGKAKPEDATPIPIRVSAIDPERQTAPPSAA
jgi:hypothetical protein